MNAVINNPYRTLGLIGNTTERELQRQISTIARYSEVGKTKTFDYDFPFFGEVNRNSQKVQEAARKIEQAKNKVHYALFWFLNNGDLDEKALNNLKEGHIDKASEIWEESLKDSVVTSKKFSAISNLSTLQLGMLTHNGSFDAEKFSSSIELKGKLLMSEMFNNFVTTVIGEGITINREIILKEFADEILQIAKPYLNKPNGLKTSQLIIAFSTYPNEIKQYVSDKFTDRPLSYIENQIETTNQKRKNIPENADEYGEQLYKTTKDDLSFLGSVLGLNNLQYQMIVNKLANEIIECSIVYFNTLNGISSFDPGNNTLKVINYAKLIGATGQTLKIIEETDVKIQDWINNKTEREKYNKVKNILILLDSNIKKLSDLADGNKILKNRYDRSHMFNRVFLSSSESNDKIEKLNNILKDIKKQYDQLLKALSASDKIVQNRGNTIVIICQNILVEIFNKSNNMFDNLYQKKENDLRTLYSITQKVKKALTFLRHYYMNENTIQHYKETLKNIHEHEINMNNALNKSCYIATMAYGSYEHPQVIELRKFRDNSLSKSSFGIGFIKIYYEYSPKLVEYLKDKPIVNLIIKSFLNTLIRIVK